MGDMSKDEFIAHVKGATTGDAAEKRKLYFELLKCFTDADIDLDGSINGIEFDGMIEAAAAYPRKYGLAPLSSEMYKTVEDRQKARKDLFKKIDGNGDGGISLDEWLGFCYGHIGEKVKAI